jgi:tetratricopeptide (TPR) repeat protein
MKEYLQLDGVVYKLVPIRTQLDPRNPYDMGRIDSNKMFDMVMKWDWGNSGDPTIYHDVETRKNGITYRSNLARLADVLIREGDFEKAEQLFDLGMEKMPVDKFEFYSLLEPFIAGYYQIGKTEKARKVFKDVTKKYQENLSYYSRIKPSKQRQYIQEIVSDIEYYRGLVEVSIIFDDEEFAKNEAIIFNDYLKQFPDFYGEEDDAINIGNDTIDSSETIIDSVE